mmetsp:Transcript_33576/g.98923  ORF Transcript_33576/g.98923 Transcript_33576/m.98923 type:complete len:393 (-) Transcript_33576:34-1212(-)
MRPPLLGLLSQGRLEVHGGILLHPQRDRHCLHSSLPQILGRQDSLTEEHALAGLGKHPPERRAEALHLVPNLLLARTERLGVSDGDEVARQFRQGQVGRAQHEGHVIAERQQTVLLEQRRFHPPPAFVGDGALPIVLGHLPGTFALGPGGIGKAGGWILEHAHVGPTLNARVVHLIGTHGRTGLLALIKVAALVPRSDPRHVARIRFVHVATAAATSSLPFAPLFGHHVGNAQVPRGGRRRGRGIPLGDLAPAGAVPEVLPPVLLAPHRGGRLGRRQHDRRRIRVVVLLGLVGRDLAPLFQTREQICVVVVQRCRRCRCSSGTAAGSSVCSGAEAPTAQESCPQSVGGRLIGLCRLTSIVGAGLLYLLLLLLLLTILKLALLALLLADADAR